jgi:hypothetical protein
MGYPSSTEREDGLHNSLFVIFPTAAISMTLTAKHTVIVLRYKYSVYKHSMPSTSLSLHAPTNNIYVKRKDNFYFKNVEISIK